MSVLKVVQMEYVKIAEWFYVILVIVLKMHMIANVKKIVIPVLNDAIN